MLEYTSLILPVGIWVMRGAIAECKKWHEAGYSDYMVHINCSALQINDNDFITALKQDIQSNQMPKGSIVCELTETMLINNLENALLFCKDLEQLGVEIAPVLWRISSHNITKGIRNFL